LPVWSAQACVRFLVIAALQKAAASCRTPNGIWRGLVTALSIEDLDYHEADHKWREGEDPPLVGDHPKPDVGGDVHGRTSLLWGRGIGAGWPLRGELIEVLAAPLAQFFGREILAFELAGFEGIVSAGAGVEPERGDRHEQGDDGYGHAEQVSGPVFEIQGAGQAGEGPKRRQRAQAYGQAGTPGLGDQPKTGHREHYHHDERRRARRVQAELPRGNGFVRAGGESALFVEFLVGRDFHVAGVLEVVETGPFPGLAFIAVVTPLLSCTRTVGTQPLAASGFVDVGDADIFSALGAGDPADLAQQPLALGAVPDRAPYLTKVTIHDGPS